MSRHTKFAGEHEFVYGYHAGSDGFFAFVKEPVGWRPLVGYPSGVSMEWMEIAAGREGLVLTAEELRQLRIDQGTERLADMSHLQLRKLVNYK